MRIFHVKHKPLYAAMGEPDNRHRRRVTIDRAIDRLMVLDGVLADRSLTWLGSEPEKWRYFNQRLGDSLRDDEYPRLVFGKRPNVRVRYFPDKLLIGYDRDHRRHCSCISRAVLRRWISRCSSSGISNCSTRWASGPFGSCSRGRSPRGWRHTGRLPTTSS
jgi:hypothetical protein